MLCITGGHITPALAVIEEIRRRGLRWNTMVVGRLEAFEGGGSPAQEERLVCALGVPFYALSTGRQGRSSFKALAGLFHALVLLKSYQPTAVLSFGGYIALPVAIAAWMLGIPVVTHEQTEHLGLANRIIARFARRVIFGCDQGMPLRRALFHPPPRPTFAIDTSHPLLYITGGSTGAHSLNTLIFPIVSELVKTYAVIHQVGAYDVTKAQAVSNRYIPADYIDETDVAWIYHHASLLVGRAGANTVAEAAAFGIPALFIPLPWAARREQTRNAQTLEKKGMAVVIDQTVLTPEALLFRVRSMMESIDQYKRSARVVAKTYPKDAASVVVHEVARILSLPFHS